MSLPHITLLPGLDGTGLLYAPLLEALGDEVEVTRVGYDPSAPQDREILLGLIRAALPSGRRTLLVGESFSGPLAITTAFRVPDRISHLVLLASFCAAPHPLMAQLARLAPLLFAHPAPRWVLRRYFLGPEAELSVIEASRRAMVSVDPAVVAQRLRLLAATQVGPELAQLPMPVHAIYGGSDRLIDAPRAVAACRRSQPELTEHFIADGPHLLAQSRPTVVADLLRSLLGLSSGGLA